MNKNYTYAPKTIQPLGNTSVTTLIAATTVTIANIICKHRLIKRLGYIKNKTKDGHNHNI